MNENETTYGFGYHVTKIEKGEIGEASKILKEVHELIDAQKQGCKIMELVELADLYGAMESYMNAYHPEVGMHDLKKMSDITKRAFKNGHR